MASTTAIYTGGGIPPFQTLNAAWARDTAVYFPNLFPLLAKGQSPQVMWIGCSDSRVPETQLLGLLPGEVFVHRNIANAVNPNDLSLPSALEYAVEHIKVQHIIVCGHLGCGGIAGTCSASLVGIPSVDLWIAPLRALFIGHLSQLAGKASADQQSAMVKINLVNSVAKISANSYVADAIAKGILQVHGTIYDVGTGLLNFLSTADMAVTASDAANPYFNIQHWYHFTNAVIGVQKFVDIQAAVVQCNGTSGTYPNQQWKFTQMPDNSFTFSTSGLPNTVATVDMGTLQLSMKAPFTGDASMQHFRPSLNGGYWAFTCDALPSSYQLNYDPNTSTLMMSNAGGQATQWLFTPTGSL